MFLVWVSDNDFLMLSPINKQQFNDLYEYCDPVGDVNNRRNISKKDLLVFLSKIRQDFSDDFFL